MRLGAFFFEILPLVGFFIAFHHLGLLPAAAISVGLGLLVLLVARFRDQRFAKFPLFSLIISACLRWRRCSLMQLFLSKSSRPCSMGHLQQSCFLGCRGAAVMREFFGDQFDLTESTWHQLSFRWACFFWFWPLLTNWLGDCWMRLTGWRTKPLLQRRRV